MFDCITIGDAGLDRFLNVPALNVENKDRNTSQICMNLGAKIPVRDLYEDIGGNACNVAFGLDCLGLSTALYTSLGADYNGRRVLDRLHDTSINLTFVSVNETERTNSATILSCHEDRSILSYKTPSTYATHNIPDTHWIYLTSLGEGCEDLVKHARDFCSTCETQLAFNPGSYFMYHKLDMIRDLLSSIDLLIVNKEEAQTILNTEETDPQQLIFMLQNRGSDAVALTDGTHGAYAGLANTIRFAPSLNVSVEEVTGAGDAFSSGFLSRYIAKEPLEDCLRAGIYNSAAVVQAIGATRGLLTKDELEGKLSTDELNIEMV